MKQDKETRSKLLQSARDEFMEKGYMKASLRNICKNAGVTTGALYFFFEDKAALFDAVIGEAVQSVYGIVRGHFEEEVVLAENSGRLTLPERGEADDFEIAKEMIHLMYRYRDDILLVLTKSQGTRYESIADEFIELTEMHYRSMADKMHLAYPDKVIDDRFVHWLAHEQIDIFIYMITHIDEEEEAVRFMSQAVTYMMSGWYGLYTT
ncbi:MAG: TetR/AcrR family transcriptional regulator [Lachnospiraceae bacterium]|nr:TetR/AcrR family transcriptional regulator [Lachnospiraceae bacterium]